MRGRLIAATAAIVLVAPVLVAQGNPKQEQEVVIPETAWPPDGMCRVWLRDVPERQQPAPTDCATALRTRPRDAMLLLGQPTKDARVIGDRNGPATDAARRTPADEPGLMRGFGFRTADPRGGAAGFAFSRTAPTPAGLRVVTSGSEEAKPIPGAPAASKAPPKPIIKPPEPFHR